MIKNFSLFPSGNVIFLRRLIAFAALAFFGFNVFAGENKALIIGISQYTEVSSLKFADADALEFSQLLTSFSGYDKSHVRLLLNQQATKKRITDEINQVIEESKNKPFDNFIFMFAGHGVESKIKRVGAGKKVEEVDTNIFLAPSDASLNENNFYQSGTSNLVTNETFINKEWLAKKIASIKAKNVSPENILLFDPPKFKPS
jgi:hypothetical protein